MVGERLDQARDIAAQSGRWVEVKQGNLIRIIDVEGSRMSCRGVWA